MSRGAFTTRASVYIIFKMLQEIKLVKTKVFQSFLSLMRDKRDFIFAGGLTYFKRFFYS